MWTSPVVAAAMVVATPVAALQATPPTNDDIAALILDEMAHLDALGRLDGNDLEFSDELHDVEVVLTSVSADLEQIDRVLGPSMLAAIDDTGVPVDDSVRTVLEANATSTRGPVDATDYVEALATLGQDVVIPAPPANEFDVADTSGSGLSPGIGASILGGLLALLAILWAVASRTRRPSSTQPSAAEAHAIESARQAFATQDTPENLGAVVASSVERLTGAKGVLVSGGRLNARAGVLVEAPLELVRAAEAKGQPEIAGSLTIVPALAGERPVGFIAMIGGNPQAAMELAPTVAQAIDRVNAAMTSGALVYIDSDTGTWNLRRFRHDSQNGFEAPDGAPHSLITVEVDHFDVYTDQNGPDAALQTIRRVADELVDSVRGTDVVYRIGDGRFAVFLRNANAAQSAHVADRVRGSVAQLTFPGGRTMPGGRLTVSAGVADTHTVVAADLISASEAALGTAQAAGRNSVATA